MKIKIFTYPLTKFGRMEEGATEFAGKDEAERELNEFCDGKTIVDVKVSTYEARFHNNGGVPQLMALYTVMYEEKAKTGTKRTKSP